jgi:hypothetical protein
LFLYLPFLHGSCKPRNTSEQKTYKCVALAS